MKSRSVSITVRQSQCQPTFRTCSNFFATHPKTMQLSLTAEQRRAAFSTATRVFIEAVPGSGKTTVAAERFGVIRYDTANDPRRILALAFTRSARDELRSRIERRWGGNAMSWPHRALTLDGLHQEILTYLLRRRTISWIGGHTELAVHETWRGCRGARLIGSDEYRRAVVLKGTQVVAKSVRLSEPGHFITGKQDFDAHLATGRCTTAEIRQIMDAVIHDKKLRTAARQYLAETVKAVIVDEVFDANRLDLNTIWALVSAGINTTLIGDPWQALYRFRGARPEHVAEFVRREGFENRPVSETFRFRDGMRALSEDARNGHRVLLAKVSATDECDVCLARKWRHLWGGPDYILPLSFGRPGNQTDAALELLLDLIVQAQFGHPARNATDAAAVLGLDRNQIRANGTLNPVLEMIRVGTTAAAAGALVLLRRLLREAGSPCQLRPLNTAERENASVHRLYALAQRMHHRRLIPGMTVHQAKGCEWPVVGLYLEDRDVDRLADGLSQHRDDDRVLYVALTRASHQTLLLTGTRPHPEEILHVK
ncbi:UvrD-helicase domain-containing protein [Nocardia sp. NPDC048505]|uniref:UvrD-helicase domain-containing protein n=1 Tax=unclassified Nocardia TaxID=2637762 RepID=UPI0033E30617